MLWVYYLFTALHYSAGLQGKEDINITKSSKQLEAPGSPRSGIFIGSSVYEQEEDSQNLNRRYPDEISANLEGEEALGKNEKAAAHSCGGNCKKGEFLCPMSCTCIPNSWRCDSDADCIQNEDELDCDNIECDLKEDQVRCPHTGNCIQKKWLCDGDDDCGDFSDETQCAGKKINCTSEEFECGNALCVPLSWTCDGENDCRDFSDELNCTKKAECSSTEFRCVDGSCISLSFKCDFTPDCPDASDETNCYSEHLRCTEFEFRCDGYPRCVLHIFRCDGDDDCGDWSDEANCPPALHTVCTSSEFRCKSGKCILKKFVCDDEQDCEGGEDEISCTKPSSKICGEGQFTCKAGNCIESSWVCDGTHDCALGEDEFNCKVSCSSETQFACNPINSTPPVIPGTKLTLLPAHSLRTNRVCIGKNHVCDGKKDCPRGEDERNCPQRIECDKNKSKCHSFCTVLPNSTESCGCYSGYILDADGISCRDINECAPESEQVCSQICTNTEGSFKCTCKPEYTLRPDGRSCKAIGAAPSLIFANRGDIRQISINNMKYSAILKGLHNTVALDFHFSKNLLFWSDLSFDVIHKSYLNGSKPMDVVKWGLQNPAGIAVDWIHDLLFWTDLGTRRLEVSDFEVYKRFTIIANDLDKPRGIAVHPGKGLVFWTDLGPSPKIESIYANGEGRKVIISENVYWPNGVTIDYPVDKLYWVDAKYHVIECSNLDGSNRKRIVTKGLPHPFALTIFDDSLYWTDWHTKSITTAHKLTGSGFKIIQSNLHFPMGIRSLHPQSQPLYKNRCGTNNGGCSYLCLPNANSYSCKCPLGSELGVDRQLCKPPSKELLLIVRKKDLRLCVLESETSISYDYIIPLEGIRSAEAVTWDWDGSSDSIFWSDAGTATISHALLNGTNQKTVITKNLDGVTGLDFDWVSRKLYWVNSGPQLIEVASVDGSMRSILVWKNLDQPRDIAVAPLHGKMFWSSHGYRPKIESADMDGTNRVTLVKDNIKLPNGLAIDFDRSRLYWVDSGIRGIQYVSFSGTDRRSVFDDGLKYPYSLAVFRNSVFWTDWNTSGIHVANKESGISHHVLRSGLSNLMDIKVFHRQRPESYSKCSINNGGCSHLCLLASKPAEFSCACPTGIKLSSDNKTCQPGPSKYLILAHRDLIRRISFDVPYIVDVVLPLAPQKNVVSVDVDTLTGDMFWTDIAAGTIMQADRSMKNIAAVIKNGLKTAESLVVDSAGRKLYWTDAHLKSIEVSDLNGIVRKVLIWQDLYNPRALAIYYKEGFMFWTDWGKNPKIERADMNGQNRKILISSNLKWPNGLTVDLEEKRIYWNDAHFNLIDHSDFEGNNRRTLIKNIQHPYGLAIYNSFLYWSDWKSEALHRVDKKTGVDRQIVSKHMAGLMELKLIEMGKSEENVCGSNNGGCSHLCLRTSTNFSCECPSGILMGEDGKTCNLIPNSFFLISSKNSLMRISMDTPEMWSVELPVVNVLNVIAINYHYNQSLIFYSDMNLKVIRQININDFSKQVDIIHTKSTVNGIAVEWIANNIYWTDGDNKIIEVAQLGGTNRKTIVKSGLEEPWSIAVFPRRGYLYWTDWGFRPKIERSLLDGSQRKAIVLTDAGFPKSLTIDYQVKRLYWVDSVGEKIETSDLHGNDRVVIFSETSTLPFGLTLIDSELFMTNVYNKSLIRIDKHSGLDKKVIKSDFDNILEVMAVAEQNQPGWSPCAVDNGGCSHLCFYRGYENGYVCACPDIPDSSCQEVPSKKIEDVFMMLDDSDKTETLLMPGSVSKASHNYERTFTLLIVLLFLLIATVIPVVFIIRSYRRSCSGRICKSRKRFTVMNPNYNSSSTLGICDKKTSLWLRFRYEKSQDRVYEVVDDPERCRLDADASTHRQIVDLPSGSIEAPPRPPKPAYLSA